MANTLITSSRLLTSSKVFDPDCQPTIKVTKKRWIVLIIFILYGTLSSLQFMQYSIIANLVCEYYNITPASVDLTGLIFMLVWPILVFPTSYLIDKRGLRITGLIGAVLTGIGSFVKVFSVGRDLYYVVLIGQTVTAISQLFILSLPPKIAVTWFSPKEVSTVCSLGTFSLILGSAVGFVLPPLIIKEHENPDEIGIDMNVFNSYLAVSAGIVALAVVCYFPREPLYPPSQAMYDERQNRQELTLKLFLTSIKDLLKNKAFVIHLLAYSCNFGVYTAFATFLNQFILDYFEKAQEDAGNMGLCTIVFGMLGSLVAGVILDKSHKFKETTIFVYVFSTLTLVGVLIALEQRLKWLVYLTVSIFGAFITSYLPCGCEFAMEITYPSPESTVSGILLAGSQLLGVVLTLILSKIMEIYNTFLAICILAAFLGLGSILTIFTPSQLKRQAAFERGIAFEKVSTSERGKSQNEKEVQS